MKSDDGAMALAMSAAMAIVAILSIAVASLGGLYAARAQATNAADAAALAAAVSTYPPASPAQPVTAAREAAESNGAVVVSCTCARDSSLDSRTVQVVTAIEVDVPVFGPIVVRAASRAEFDPILWLGR